jgi:energy-coupling factor transporter ATP-binding protein EcfA2
VLLNVSIFLLLVLNFTQIRLSKWQTHCQNLNILMKKQNILWLFVGILLIGMSGCGKTKVAPLSERIAKNWSANIVKEGSTTVYTKGASTNAKPGYSQFRLNLSSQTSVTLIEFDGNSFAGQWEISTDEKTLTLKNLNPQPTGTGGTIAYTIGEITDTSLRLTRTAASAKTGNTVNDYTLSNP